MLARQWLQGFIVFDAFLITILTFISFLGSSPQPFIAMAMFFWVGVHLWEVFRRRKPRVAANPQPTGDEG